MRKAGFSFVELMVVMVIIGILATFATVSYNKYAEKNRANTGVSNLIAIYNAEKRYKLDNNSYYIPAICNASTGCTNTINQNLKDPTGNPYLAIFDPYFSYRIIKPAGVTYYKATATRKVKIDCGTGTKIYGVIAFQDNLSTMRTNCKPWVSGDIVYNATP
jgi:prepilin-type N-terminal cleavage/methylation domain-containing protein